MNDPIIVPEFKYDTRSDIILIKRWLTLLMVMGGAGIGTIVAVAILTNGLIALGAIVLALAILLPTISIYSLIERIEDNV